MKKLKRFCRVYSATQIDSRRRDCTVTQIIQFSIVKLRIEFCFFRFLTMNYQRLRYKEAEALKKSRFFISS